MIASIKNHPFAVEAYFESSLVLTYAIPKERLQNLIPECLELDTHDDRWAFVAVALVQTKHLRPKGFPEFMGNDFFLIGLRIFVKYHTNAGKRLRGLYILKSQTNKKQMTFLGNFFTHYNYTTTDISFSKENDNASIRSKQSDLDIEVKLYESDVDLPFNSPFKDWKEARRFAGPLPFTFTYNSKNKEVLIIEGVRENWTPQPVKVIKNKVGFMQDLKLNDAVLANAFIVEHIPYYWKKGRLEKWKQ